MLTLNFRQHANFTDQLSVSQDALAVVESNLATSEAEKASIVNGFSAFKKSAASDISALRAEITELKCVARHADNKTIIAEREQKQADANAAKWKKERDGFEARAILAERKVRVFYVRLIGDHPTD